MQSIRIQPALQGEMLIDVVCDCGANGLTNESTGAGSFKHPIQLDAGNTVVLVCDVCQREYAIVTQGNHFHITSKIPPVSEKILFYGGTKYFLSNFSSFKVRWRDFEWMTSEHAYQAAKFDDPEIVDKIKSAISAYDAKKIAQANRAKAMKNWPEIKMAIMEEILRAKLARHPYIQRKLFESGQREIVENSPTDSFWGRGPDWKGQNWLGRIWMKLRAEMQLASIVK